MTDVRSAVASARVAAFGPPDFFRGRVVDQREAWMRSLQRNSVPNVPASLPGASEAYNAALAEINALAERFGETLVKLLKAQEERTQYPIKRREQVAQAARAGEPAPKDQSGALAAKAASLEEDVSALRDALIMAYHEHYVVLERDAHLVVEYTTVEINDAETLAVGMLRDAFAILEDVHDARRARAYAQRPGVMYGRFQESEIEAAIVGVLEAFDGE